MKEKILSLLSKNEYISGEELSRRLGITRTAVWKHIQALKSEGYSIKSKSRKGYKLQEVPDLLQPVLIYPRLRTEYIGKKIHYFSALDSTNDKAKQIADTGAPEGSVVLAEKQIKGKGRLGRAWESPSGGIWMSVILRPPIPPGEAQCLTLVAACSVVAALRKLNIPAAIKWPNDILVEGKKICGILTELKAEIDKIHFVILGMGINVNTEEDMYPPELRRDITSIKMYLGNEIDRVRFLCSVFETLEQRYNLFIEKGCREVIKEWKKYNLTLNKPVTVRSGNGVFSGTAVGVNTTGGLIVSCEDGEIRTFYSGEVTLEKDT